MTNMGLFIKIYFYMLENCVVKVILPIEMDRMIFINGIL